MPCQHICSVLDKSENYVPSLFHIRWYKLYSYYYTKSVNNEICSNTKEALENMLLCTRKNSYRMSGKYKGIFIMNTPFIDKLDQFSVKIDEVTKLMDFILHETKMKGALISNSYDIQKNLIEMI